MSYMFSFSACERSNDGCSSSSLTSLDLSSFDTSNVLDMSMMFEGTLSLNNIIYGDNFIHNQDADINLMFEGSPALKPTHESWNGVF